MAYRDWWNEMPCMYVCIYVCNMFSFPQIKCTTSHPITEHGGINIAPDVQEIAPKKYYGSQLESNI